MSRPTEEELEKKIWYRFLKVVFVMVALVLFSSPLITAYAVFDKTIIKTEYYYITCQDKSFHRVPYERKNVLRKSSQLKLIDDACGANNVPGYKIDIKTEYTGFLNTFFYITLASSITFIGVMLFLILLKKGFLYIIFYIIYGKKIDKNFDGSKPKNLNFSRDNQDKTVIKGKSQSWSVRHSKLVGSAIIIVVGGLFLWMMIADSLNSL